MKAIILKNLEEMIDEGSDVKLDSCLYFSTKMRHIRVTFEMFKKVKTDSKLFPEFNNFDRRTPKTFKEMATLRAVGYAFEPEVTASRRLIIRDRDSADSLWVLYKNGHRMAIKTKSIHILETTDNENNSTK